MAVDVGEMCSSNFKILMRAESDDTEEFVYINILQLELFLQRLKGKNYINNVCYANVEEDSEMGNGDELMSDTIDESQLNSLEASQKSVDVILYPNGDRMIPQLSPQVRPVDKATNTETRRTLSPQSIIKVLFHEDAEAAESDNIGITVVQNEQNTGDAFQGEIRNIDTRHDKSLDDNLSQLRRSERISNVSVNEEGNSRNSSQETAEDPLIYEDDEYISYDGSNCAPPETVNKEIKSGYVNQTRVFSCKLCKLESPRAADVRKHVRQVHFQEKPYTCIRCQQNFVTKTVARKHLQTHKARSGMHCDKVLKMTTALKLHRSHIHQNEGGYYVCGRCESAFVNKALLQKHFQLAHLSLRTFKCETCGQAFKFLCNLRRHEVVHRKPNQ